jgi:hypothetical protein
MFSSSPSSGDGHEDLGQNLMPTCHFGILQVLDDRQEAVSRLGETIHTSSNQRVPLHAYPDLPHEIPGAGRRTRVISNWMVSAGIRFVAGTTCGIERMPKDRPFGWIRSLAQGINDIIFLPQGFGESLLSSRVLRCERENFK